MKIKLYNFTANIADLDLNHRQSNKISFETYTDLDCKDMAGC